MRYILDDVHPDQTLYLRNLFKEHEFIVNDFRKNKDFSFIKENDCMILSIFSLLGNERLFLSLKNKYFCYSANMHSENIYQYFGSNKNCKGFLCSAIENQNHLTSMGYSTFFAPRIYPDLENILNQDFNSDEISVLINNYKSYDGYQIFKLIKENCKSNIKLYDCSTQNSGKDIDILMKTRYCLHIKQGGHVCNAPIKALALGIPVIMDYKTYNLGQYAYYMQHGFNSLIIDNIENIISALEDAKDNIYYRLLKTNCLNSRDKFVKHYSNIFYKNFKKFLSTK
jgi:hypothetical protein